MNSKTHSADRFAVDHLLDVIAVLVDQHISPGSSSRTSLAPMMSRPDVSLARQ